MALVASPGDCADTDSLRHPEKQNTATTVTTTIAATAQKRMGNTPASDRNTELIY